MIRLKKNIALTDAQCNELLDKCGSDTSIIKMRSQGHMLISDVTESWNICVSVNQDGKWVRVDGECGTNANILSSTVVKALCDMSADFKAMTDAIPVSTVTEDLLKNVEVPVIFVPSARSSAMVNIKDVLIFQAKLIESKSSEEDKVMYNLLSYSGTNDAFFIFTPGSDKVKVLMSQGVDDARACEKICDEISTFTESIGIPAEELPLYTQNLIHKHSLDHKDQQTDNDLDHLVKENESLKEEIRKLQFENDKLNACLEKTDKRPLLYYGDEKDLYKEEIKDFILEAIKVQMNAGNATNGSKRSRRYDVLKSVFDANDYTGSHEEKREALKQALNGYRSMTSSVRTALEEIGFTIEHDKHCKVKFCNDNRYESVLPSTGSDGRLGKNAYTVIKNSCL